VGGPCAGALEAIGDVVAWNTVWDRYNHRPYTTLTRQWVPVKFGGWITWLNDIAYHALLAAHVDREVADQNVRTVLSMATPEGNLACLLSEHDEWVDRTQPPVLSYVLWLMYLRSGATALLELAYDTLGANHRWWFAHRDGNGNGLLEFGTSNDGTGLFVGTKLACKDESTMDNSPLWDEARFVPGSGTLDVEDVGLNSLLALDAEMLGFIATALGRADEAASWQAEGVRLRAGLGALWDGERGIFANRHWDGHWSTHLAPTSFYPLLAGAATPDQAARMVREHLLNPKEFWGDWVLPSITRDDPAALDNVYWRGRIWPPLVFLVCQGLRRYGFDTEAHEVAVRSMNLFMREWSAHAHCCENFNAQTGEGCDSVDTDSFYTWGALLPLLACADLLDVGPWRGMELGGEPDDEAQAIRLLRLRDGVYSYAVGGGWRVLKRDGQEILRTDARGRLTHVQIAETYAEMVVPPQERDVTVCWPTTSRDRLVEITVDGVSVHPADDHVALHLTPCAARRHIVLLCRL
jgi:putative isomerase